MKGIYVVEPSKFRFCPWCGERLIEVLTSAPPKCARCLTPLSALAWVTGGELKRAKVLLERLHAGVEFDVAAGKLR